LISLSIFNKIYAQSNKYKIGLISGVSTWHGNGRSSDRLFYARVSGCIGLNIDIKILKKLSLCTSILHETKGFDGIPRVLETNYTLFGPPLFFTYIRYVTIPVLGKVSFGKRFKVHLNLGPHISVKLNESIYLFDIKQMYVSKISYINKYDYGITYGAGISYLLRSNLIAGLDIRKSNGILNVSNVEISGFQNPKTVSLSIIFGVAYIFGPEI
jgi:hypothetical protein